MMGGTCATMQCSSFTSQLVTEQTLSNSNLKLVHRLSPFGNTKRTPSMSMFANKNTTTIPRMSSIITAVSSIDAPTSQETTTATTAPGTDRFTQKDWDEFVKAYTSQYCEHAMFLDSSNVEGTIPKELQGTLLRNGPALYEIGGKKIPQPFDGDGMAAMFAFPGNGQPPFVSNRFVRTEDYVAEQEAGKMLFRGAFSVGNPSGDGFYNPFDLSIKKVANTGIVAWAGRILALYERDLPYQLAGPDLKTIGRTDCDGAIDGDYFAAHYRILTDEKDGSRRLIGFNSAESGLNNKVTVWEFDEAGNQLHKTEAEFPDAAFAFLHDFAVTEKHYIFLENPVRLNLGKLVTKYMFGKACIAECLKYDTTNKSTKIHVIPRPGTTAPGAPAIATTPRVYTTPTPFFSFHHINAFEAPDGRIVVDTVALLDGMDFSANLEIGAGYYSDNVGRGTLTRLVVTPWTGQVEQKPLMERACEFPCVAPAVAGKAHTHAYLVAARMDDAQQWGAPQVVAKVTVSPELGVSVPLSSASAFSPAAAAAAVQKVYNPGPGRWAQEPLFVPNPNGTNEDDGWVLVLVFDSAAKSTELVILDAQEMIVTGKVKLPFFLPAGLHGSWSGDYMGAPVGEEYPAKLYDIRNGATKYE